MLAMMPGITKSSDQRKILMLINRNSKKVLPKLLKPSNSKVPSDLLLLKKVRRYMVNPNVNGPLINRL